MVARKTFTAARNTQNVGFCIIRSSIAKRRTEENNPHSLKLSQEYVFLQSRLYSNSNINRQIFCQVVYARQSARRATVHTRKLNELRSNIEEVARTTTP